MLLVKYVGRERTSGFAGTPAGRCGASVANEDIARAGGLRQAPSQVKSLSWREKKLLAVTAEEMVSVRKVGGGFQSKAGGLGWQRWTAELRRGCHWSPSASDLVFRVESR